MPQPISQRMQSLQAVAGPIYRFFTQSAYSRRMRQPGIADFVAGNPQELPLPGFVAALQEWAIPQNKDWYAYPESQPEAQAAVAEALRQWRGVPFDPRDIFLTNGAFAALSVALNAIVDPGDEVIFNSPPWFFYELLITGSGATPVRVKVSHATFDLDVAAIEAAITAHTRAIIVNSPNNPTGKIYSPATLEALGAALEAASRRNGRTIYLLSDEAYSRIIYDGHDFVSPTQFYPASMLLYTYGKTLLTPGQRLGYIALPPGLPERDPLQDALFVSQLMTGYAFPNALLQHALPDLEKLSIDVAHLQRRRDRMVRALRGMGYELHVPEATFYLLPRSPWPDDWAFVERLAEQDVFVLPGATVEMPGYFRISLTANDDMVEQALPAFAQALAEPA